MAELTLSEQAILNGGSWVSDVYTGGRIAALLNMYVAARNTQDAAGYCTTAWLDLLDSIAKLLANIPVVRVYKDSTDEEDEFSVAAATLPYGGLVLAYAGETNLGPMVAGADNHIWLDLSGATVEAGFGATWPLVQHIRLATIAMPATGHWEPDDITRLPIVQLAITNANGLDLKKVLAFGTSSPIAVATAPADTLIGKRYVVVTTAFNGTAPTLKVGDAGDDDRLIATTDADLKTVGMYEIPGAYTYASETPIVGVYAADGSTAGEALIILEVL